MLLKYCPKREHFSFKGMVARTQLAAMDNNENVGRGQAVDIKGTDAGALIELEKLLHVLVKLL